MRVPPGTCRAVACPQQERNRCRTGEQQVKSSLRDGVFRLFRYNVLSFALRLVTSIVIARTMGPAVMGVWLLLSLLPTYAEGFVRLKVDIASVYVLARGEWELGEVSFAVAVVALLSSLPVAAALLLLEPTIIAWLFGAGAVDPVWYRLVVLTIPIQFLALGYSYLILHLEDVSAYNIQNFLRTVLPSLAAAALILTTPLRLGALTGSMMLGATAALLYGAFVVHRRARPRRASKPGLYSQLWSFGRRMYLAGAIENLNQYLGSLLVGVHLQTRDLAFLRLGQDRLQVLDQVTASMNTLLFPRIAREQNADLQADLLARSTRVLMLVLGVAAVIGALLTPLLVRLLYGTDYLPMAWSIWLLLPGVVLLGVTSPVTQYLMGSGRPDLVWKLGLVPLVLQVAALVPAINAWGFRGAAAAISVSFMAHAAARLLLVRAVAGRAARAFVVPRYEDWRMLIAFLRERLGALRRARQA